jgi:peptide/nickel transport system ATP-binding protein
MNVAIVSEPQGDARVAAAPLLEVRGLEVEFMTPRGVLRAVDGLSYSVRRGEILAIVGESGCGKSVSSLAVMGLLTKPAGRVVGGSILFEGRDLLGLPEEELRELRGRDIGMIFQEPMTSLNPVMRIGDQITESLKVHLGMGRAQAQGRAAELLKQVGITDVARRLRQYPHHLSGGMRQRVMIAIALACNPKLIIADEPTTALDVTIQAQILELMQDLSRRLDIAIIIITHNLGIVARYADSVNVMYAARAVEQGRADRVFGEAAHPYTVGLMNAIPRLDRPRESQLATIDGLPPDLLHPPRGCRYAPRCPARIERCVDDPALAPVGEGHVAACWRAQEVRAGLPLYEGVPAALREAGRAPAPAYVSVDRLVRRFPVASGGFFKPPLHVTAVDGVSFEIEKGRTLGLVGESGCGKSTIGRMLLNLDTPTDGSFVVGGVASGGKGASRGAWRRQTQVIFQDPFSSLNPRMTVGQILEEPLKVYKLEPHAAARRAKAEALLGEVGLFSYVAQRYPHELSGGQRQRVGIARALALQPDVIVCDEPVSALDVSIQGQIINLLKRLQDERGLTYLFIAHDLAVVRHISHRVAVMYLGRIMEIAGRDELYANPQHPYTRMLLDAAPVPDPIAERARKPRDTGGELPSPIDRPTGCVFRTRCPLATSDCAETVPALRSVSDGDHRVACIKV